MAFSDYTLLGKAATVACTTPSLSATNISSFTVKESHTINENPIDNSLHNRANLERKSWVITFTTNNEKMVFDTFPQGTPVTALVLTRSAAVGPTGTAESALTETITLSYGYVADVSPETTTNGERGEITVTINSQLEDDGDAPTLTRSIA